MIALAVAAPLLMMLQVSAEKEGSARARETAYARIEAGRRIAADPELVRALVARNETKETPEEVKARDKEWMANPKYALRKTLTSNPCAQHLKSMIASDPIVVEAFLMDQRGGIVCSTVETSDYWQGDEAKWKKTYEEGKAVFIDEPALDQSTDTYAVQLSLLVSEGGRKVGALTLTLKIPREAGK